MLSLQDLELTYDFLNAFYLVSAVEEGILFLLICSRHILEQNIEPVCIGIINGHFLDLYTNSVPLCALIILAALK